MNNGILSDTKRRYDARVYPVINLTADSNNVQLPREYDIIRITSNAVYTITGIVGIKDKIYTIFNVGLFDIRFANLSIFSMNGNRIIVSTGSDIIVSPNESLTLFYDDVSKAWRTSGVIKSSSPTDFTSANVYEFGVSIAPITATGSSGSWTWTLPASAKFLEVIAIGAGGGGGSGRRGAAGTARFGGGGGSGGSAILVTTSILSWTSLTLTVGVSAGGPGGAAVIADNTDGNNGASPSMYTYVAFNGANISAAQIMAPNGQGGFGGSASSGAGGAFVSNSSDSYKPTSGGASSITGQAGMIAAGNGLAGISGPGGGGIAANNTAYLGGATNFGGPVNPSMQSAFLGVNYNTVTLNGGNASTTAAAGSGSNGYLYGGGGAGGGASANGFNSGAGGNGRDGYVRITVWS